MEGKEGTSETTDTTKVKDNPEATTTTTSHTETGAPAIEKTETVIEKKAEGESEQ